MELKQVGAVPEVQYAMTIKTWPAFGEHGAVHANEVLKFVPEPVTDVLLAETVTVPVSKVSQFFTKDTEAAFGHKQTEADLPMATDSLCLMYRMKHHTSDPCGSVDRATDS